MTIIQQGGSVGRSVTVSSSGNDNNNNNSNGGKTKKLVQSCNSSSPLLLSQQEEGMVAAVNGVDLIRGSGDGGGGGGSTGNSIVVLSSPGKTFCNLVISIVGAGVLGLPYAFKVSGWLEASLIMCALSLTMYYCMMLLVWSRRRMERDWGVGEIPTYSKLGFHAFGTAGQAAVDAMVLLSQGGFCIAYLIFIGENLASVFMRRDSLSTAAANLLPNSQQMGAAAAASDLMGSMWKTKEIYIWIVFPLQVSELLNHHPTIGLPRVPELLDHPRIGLPSLVPELLNYCSRIGLPELLNPLCFVECKLSSMRGMEIALRIIDSCPLLKCVQHGQFFMQQFFIPENNPALLQFACDLVSRET